MPLLWCEGIHPPGERRTHPTTGHQRDPNPTFLSLAGTGCHAATRAGHGTGAAEGPCLPGGCEPLYPIGLLRSCLPSPGEKLCCLEKGWRGGVGFFISSLEIHVDCWDCGGELGSSGMEWFLCCSNSGCIQPSLVTDRSWEASVPPGPWKSPGLAEMVQEQLKSAADP